MGEDDRLMGKEKQLSASQLQEKPVLKSNSRLYWPRCEKCKEHTAVMIEGMCPLCHLEKKNNPKRTVTMMTGLLEQVSDQLVDLKNQISRMG